MLIHEELKSWYHFRADMLYYSHLQLSFIGLPEKLKRMCCVYSPDSSKHERPLQHLLLDSNKVKQQLNCCHSKNYSSHFSLHSMAAHANVIIPVDFSHVHDINPHPILM